MLALLRGARIERWQRVALASAKQCGRAVLPEIRVPLTLTTYLEEPSSAMRMRASAVTFISGRKQTAPKLAVSG